MTDGGRAAHLRSVAGKLGSEEPLTLSYSNGRDSVTLDMLDRAEFGVNAERETGDDEPELSVEIKW